MKRLFFIASVLFLAACSSGQHVTVKSDEFNRGVEVLGVADHANPFGQRMARMWRLRSFINPISHTVKHQAYFYVAYTGPSKYFKFATDETGTKLKTTPIYKVNCMSDSCEKSEAVGIDVEDTVLRAHADTGYRVKIFAKSGNQFVLAFTPKMIREQLEVVDEYLHGAPH